MTVFPYYFTDYPRMQASFPFTIDIHTVDVSYPSHRHDFLEISLMLEGRGTETVNGSTHAMEPGTLTLVLPYQYHELRAYPGSPLKLFNCMFSAELLMDNNDYPANFKDLLLAEEDDRPTYLQVPPAKIEPISRIFREMLDEFECNRNWRNSLIKAKLIEGMIHIDRLRTESQREQTHVEEPGDIPGSIWRVIYHMHMNYRDPLTLAGLAEIFHFNVSYLSEQIKRHASKNFVHLLHEIRLRHACSLLASTKMKVSDIAYEVGYGSTKTLFKAFQKYKGVTPGKYRSHIS